MIYVCVSLRVRMAGDWFLARLHRDYGIGIIVATRHIDTASFLGDIVVTMSSGKVIQVGNSFTNRYINKANDIEFDKTRLITDIGRAFKSTNKEVPDPF